MIGAGDLRDKVGFYRRETLSPESPLAIDYGNTEGEFPAAPAFDPVSAQIKPKLGGEGVLAARLSGKNLANITVRQSTQTADVTTDWVVKDARSGEVYNIRSIIDPYKDTAQRGRYWELLCEKGVAT